MDEKEQNEIDETPHNEEEIQLIDEDLINEDKRRLSPQELQARIDHFLDSGFGKDFVGSLQEKNRDFIVLILLMAD